jgi:hypothetical protein
LIDFQKVARHSIWSNKHISPLPEDSGRNLVQGYTISNLQEELGFDLSEYSFNTARKDQVLKNCVSPDVGKHIFNEVARDKGTVGDVLEY